MLLKNIFYAILLGVGMAACLSQSDKQRDEGTASSIVEENTTDTPTTPVAPSPEQLQIGPNKVGFVTIGQDIKQMRQNIPTGFSITDTTLQQEGMQSTAYIIRPEQQAKGFMVEQQCNQECKVWRLKVTSEEYKTPKGIHVGSTYAQASKAHPINTVTLADGGLVAVAKEGGITFVLNAEQVPAAKRGRLTPDTVPAETQVKGILVY